MKNKILISAFVGLVVVLGSAYYVLMPRVNLTQKSASQIINRSVKSTEKQEAVALELEVKNTSFFQKETIRSQNFKLYDAKGETMKGWSVISQDDVKSFKTLKQVQLAPGQQKNVNLVFTINKSEQNYKLKYKTEGIVPYERSEKFSSQLVTHNSDKVQNLMQSFVSAVFLGQKVTQPKNLSNIFDKDRAVSMQDSVANLQNTILVGLGQAEEVYGAVDDNFDVSKIYNEAVSLNQFLQNQQKILSYKIIELEPNYAAIEVLPQVVDISKMDVIKWQQELFKWAEANVSNYPDLDSFLQAAVAYEFGLIKGQIKNLPEIKGEPEILVMSKDDNGRWMINNQTDDYNNLAEQFFITDDESDSSLE